MVVKGGYDGAVMKGGAEIRVAHGGKGEPRSTIEKRRKGRAESDAVIGGGGLHEEFFDEAGGSDFPVGLGIQSHATRQAKIFATRFFKSHPDNAEYRLLAHFLHSIGDIFVQVADIAFRFARGAEGRREIGVGAAAVSDTAMDVKFVGGGAVLQKHPTIDPGLL